MLEKKSWMSWKIKLDSFCFASCLPYVDNCGKFFNFLSPSLYPWRFSMANAVLFDQITSMLLVVVCFPRFAFNNKWPNIDSTMDENMFLCWIHNMISTLGAVQIFLPAPSLERFLSKDMISLQICYNRISHDKDFLKMFMLNVNQCQVLLIHSWTSPYWHLIAFMNFSSVQCYWDRFLFMMFEKLLFK